MMRHYFIKRVRSFFVLMIIPTLVLFLAGGFLFVTEPLRRIQGGGSSVIDSYSSSLEVSSYNIASQLSMMTGHLRFSLPLRNMLARDTMLHHEVAVFNIINSYFGSLHQTYPFIHSIYLHLNGYDRFLSSASSQVADIHTYHDTSWLNEYFLMQEEQDGFAGIRQVQRFWFEEYTEVISLYQRLNQIDGVVVINLNKAAYFELIRSKLVLDYQDIFLLNSNGHILGSTLLDANGENKNLYIEQLLSSYIASGMYSEIDRRWHRVGRNLFYVHLRPSLHHNTYIVAVTSFNYLLNELTFYLMIMLSVIFLDIIIILLLSYTYTKRSFNIINECLDLFYEAEKGTVLTPHPSEVKDEYGVILNNIIFLYLKNNQMQQAALQLQINPHFIFNTLQIMDFEILKNLGSQSSLHKITLQFSKVVKYALEDPSKKVTLNEELDQLKAYLEIQRVRFGNDIITYFETDESILGHEVFRLILQPLVENCFEHGMSDDSTNIVVKIKIFDRENEIFFAVVDNGKGMSKNKLDELKRNVFENIDKSSKNIGLRNVNHRLLLHYGEHSRLKIRSKNGWGTVVSFIVPKCNK